MSIKGMTDDEWASYEIGEAVRKKIYAGNHDAETLAHIEAVFGWVKKYTKPEQLHSVSLMIGYLIDEPFDGEVPSIRGHSSLYQNDQPPEPSRPSRTRKPDPPDDIPF